VLASCLNVDVGKYTHFSDSLHIYESNFEDVERVINAEYEFDIYDYEYPFNLMSYWSSLEEFDKDLAFFFEYEQRARNGEEISSADMEISEMTGFMCAALHICIAYIYHKKKEYLKSLGHICTAYMEGLSDVAISCLEFVMRKYQKIGQDFADDMLDRIEKYFNGYELPKDRIKPIMYYIAYH
jgi:hypothetical protein